MWQPISGRMWDGAYQAAGLQKADKAAEHHLSDHVPGDPCQELIEPRRSEPDALLNIVRVDDLHAVRVKLGERVELLLHGLVFPPCVVGPVRTEHVRQRAEVAGGEPIAARQAALAARVGWRQLIRRHGGQWWHIRSPPHLITTILRVRSSGPLTAPPILDLVIGDGGD